MAQSPKPAELLICDTNVVIKMYLFKAAAMFSARYSFGVVRVHSVVLSEIEAWIARNNSKCAKFGRSLLEDVVLMASKYAAGLKEPTDQQRKKGMSTISAIETRLDSAEMGAATSIPDKELLVCAYVNNANLATQERTLTAVAKKSLGEERVFSFEDLVLDLLKSQKLSPTEVEEGLQTLERMNERLSSAGVARLRSAAASRPS